MVSDDTGIGWVKFYTVLNYIAGIVGCPVAFVLWAKVYGFSGGAVGFMALVGLALGALAAFSWDCLVCTPAIKIYELSSQSEQQDTRMRQLEKSIQGIKGALEKIEVNTRLHQATQGAAIAGAGDHPLVASAASPVIASKLAAMLSNVNAKDEDGRSVLMKAIAGGEGFEVVKAVLEAGADVGARDDDGKTALMWAAQYSRDARVVEALVNAGASVSAVDSSGRRAAQYLESRRDYDTFCNTDDYSKMRQLLFS